MLRRAGIKRMLFQRLLEKKDSMNIESDSVINRVVLLPVENISPNSGQPRRKFSDTSLQDLARSIEQNGLLQPVSVRETSSGQYELIAGERRLRAFKLLQRNAIPAIVEERDDMSSHTLALIENLQRDDLGFFEQAQAIRALMDAYKMTQSDVAHRLGMAQSTVANKLRLLKLSPELRSKIEESGFTERHARCLLVLEDPSLQMEAVTEIEKRGMNVAQTERYIDHLLEERRPKQTSLFFPKDVRIFLNTITRALDMMKSAGIPALSEQNEDEEYIRYTVSIPKSVVNRNRPQIHSAKTADSSSSTE